MKISKTLAAVLTGAAVVVGATVEIPVTVWRCPDGRVWRAKASTVTLAVGPEGETAEVPVEAVTPELEGCQPQGVIRRAAVVATWSPTVVLSEDPQGDLDAVTPRLVSPSCVDVRVPGGSWGAPQIGTAPYVAAPELEGVVWRLREGCTLAAAPRVLRRVVRGGDPEAPWKR